MFSVSGRRPTAIRTFSAVIDCDFPFLSWKLTVAPFGRLFHGFDLRAGFDANAFFLEGFLQFGRNFFVLERHDARQGFENRHFRAERPENRRELDAHGARAHDHQRFRNRRQLQNFAIGQNHLPVDLHARKRAGFRAGGEHRVVRFDFGGLAVFFDGYAAGTGDAPPAGDRVHFVLLEEKADPAGMLLDDLVLAREHRGPVDLHVFDFEAELFGALKVVVNIGVVQKYFCGDAADVQAGAAEKGILLDDGGFQAPLAGADRGDVAARPAADNYQIIFGHSGPPLLSFPLRPALA